MGGRAGADDTRDRQAHRSVARRLSRRGVRLESDGAASAGGRAAGAWPAGARHRGPRRGRARDRRRDRRPARSAADRHPPHLGVPLERARAALPAPAARRSSSAPRTAGSPTTCAASAYIFADRVLLRRFDRVILVSHAMRRRLPSWWVPDSRVRILHNALMMDSYGANFSPRSGEPGSAGRVNLLNVGRLSPEKGQALLLRAVARLQDRVPGRPRCCLRAPGRWRANCADWPTNSGSPADVALPGLRARHAGAVRDGRPRRPEQPHRGPAQRHARDGVISVCRSSRRRSEARPK